MVTTTALEAELLEVAGAVPDPELPVLTLLELGVLRAVHAHGPDSVEVELTPTYTGCPAVEAMALDIERVLHEHGVRDVTVRKVLAPAWSTDDITDEGRRKLREFGIAPPRAGRVAEPVGLRLGPTRTLAQEAGEAADPVRCPHCGSAETELLSRFSSTACKALRRCLSCREPFDHFKEL
ncbi:1,2-phenylacetyl-CoA epoxidase subunit PaaD [Streptomyces resistomycificus]|uniref:Phenylacetic acid degradation protein PaaD n=1 Tax=Streptomyces resistomycificus TaxID=67356 RepID=A0A0L8LA09_9ACTN|nr:1,2-phenylacetyl-CoA epoxidase subunit PaaD [Streptomyces resistomycificus]KOG35058.1 phenylacetic acid degradation protein PaaD [Streptomyces resistomycificus]KUN97744.1 phenylacetate-CoA oxygenase subunit PaaJ [Streptomyces resistomycificus]